MCGRYYQNRKLLIFHSKMESLPFQEDLKVEITSELNQQTFEESKDQLKTMTFQTLTNTTSLILQTYQSEVVGEESLSNRMQGINNEFSVDSNDKEDNETSITKLQLEYLLAPKGSEQDSSLVPQSAKSGKSDELRILCANIELDQFSLEGNSELYLKDQNILELAAIGQKSLLQLVYKGIKHFEIFRDPNNNQGYDDLLKYLQSLHNIRNYVILTFQNNEMANITRLCSTYCLSHLSFQLRIGPVKEKLLNFLSLLAKNQQQTIIDASGIRELSQEQLLIICRRMEMHGHKELMAADYIGKNEEEIQEFYKFPIIEDNEEFKKKYTMKTSNSSIYIFHSDHYVIKTPIQTIEQDQGNIQRTLQNLIVEQQMIQVLAYKDENILTQMSEVIVLKNNKFVYYLAYKPLYEVYQEIRDPTRLLRDSVLLASYLYELHLNSRLYHGDIKPANIFMYPNGIGLLRTDCDSLVSLNHQTSTVEEVYQIRAYTRGYASKELISLLNSAAANNKRIFFCQQFLMEEDFRQFKTTVMKIFRKTQSSQNNDPLLYQFIDQLQDPNLKTVEQFFDFLLFSSNFFKDFINFLRNKNNYSFSKGFQAFIPMLFDHIIKKKVWFFRNKLLWDPSNTYYREKKIDQDLELNLYFIQDLSYELVIKQRSEEKYEKAIQVLLSLRSKREGGQIIQSKRQDLKWLDKLREISKVYMWKLVNFLEQNKETEESVQEGKIIALNLLEDFAQDPEDPKQSQLRLMIDSLIFTLWGTITCINHSFTTLRDRILTEHVDFVYTTIQLYTSDDYYKTLMLNHFKLIKRECFHIQAALA